MTDSEAEMNLLRKVPLFANLKDEDKVCIEEKKNGGFPLVECSFRKGSTRSISLFFSREISLSGKNRVTKKSLSLATDPVRFSAKFRFYSAVRW